MHAAEVAEAVRYLRTGDTLREEVEGSPTEQHSADLARAIDVFTVTMSGGGLYWDGLVGEALDTGEVRKARKLGIDYFRDTGAWPVCVCGGEADGTHRSRLVAKEVSAVNAPALFAAAPPVRVAQARPQTSGQRSMSTGDTGALLSRCHTGR